MRRKRLCRNCQCWDNGKRAQSVRPGSGFCRADPPVKAEGNSPGWPMTQGDVDFCFSGFKAITITSIRQKLEDEEEK